MLTSKTWSQADIDTHMDDLKRWLAEVRDTPAEEMAAFFASRTDVYEDVHLSHWADEYAHIADYFEEGLTTLLDIGCGTGLELEALYRRFPRLHVTGVDLCEAMLQKLRVKYREQRPVLLRADYTTYPFAENAYDAALSFETLHHFPYAQKQSIYEQLYRTIRPGGTYIECDYVACCDEEEALCLDIYAYRRSKTPLPAGTFVHIDIPLTRGHQMELLTNAGFQCVDVPYQNGTTAIFVAVKPTA